MTALEFLTSCHGLPLYLTIPETARLSRTNRGLRESTAQWLRSNKGAIMARPHWGIPQKQAWMAVREATVSYLWHIDNGRCIFCHKPWYAYSRPLLPLSLDSHEICLFKRIERCPDGPIVLPVFPSLFGKVYTNYRISCPMWP